MPRNQGEKRKKSSFLDYETIKASAVANRDYINEIKGKIAALKDVDFERLMAMSGLFDLNEDEALQLLASKLTVTGVNSLRRAIKHVPKNITRVLSGVPLRLNFIHKIFTTENMKTNGRCSSVSTDELSIYIKFIETYCAAFLGETESDDHLWELTKTEDVIYNKFLSPPVSLCILCDKALTIRNNPSKAKLFTLKGPVPCTKITLECRACSLVYGVCNYTDKCGTRFYQHDVGIIEISDVSYMDAMLYKWFPALRCVICQLIVHQIPILCTF